MDFRTLREAGIRHLQELAGEVWTDHNVHDPGITILEQFCYALTDLYYRLGYDMPDLLAGQGKEDPYRSLPTPAEILTTQPVTLDDLRKLVLDAHKSVRNARVEKTRATLDPPVYYDEVEQSITLERPLRPDKQPLRLRGMYDVQIVVEGSDPYNKAIVERAVADKLRRGRNVGEDINRVAALKEVQVRLQLDIELSEEVDVRKLRDEILDAVAEYISPKIPFVGLDEARERGYSMEEIFRGPRLERGIVLTADLEQYPIRRALLGSDLIRLIMEERRGVAAIGHFAMEAELGGEVQLKEWILDLGEQSDSVFTLDRNGSTLKFYRKGVSIPVEKKPADAKNPFMAFFGPLFELGERLKLEPVQNRSTDFSPERGRDRHPGDYFSLQRQLPEIYGVGERGLSARVGPRRLAQALQLKAYLTFFDQILANSFAQWAEAHKFFDLHSELHPDPQADPDRPFGPTYFERDLEGENGVPNLGAVLKPENFSSQQSDPTIDYNRYNRLYNHLLARYGDDVTDYTLLKQPKQEADPLETLRQKHRILLLYPLLSRRRAGGFDYTRAPSLDLDRLDESNVSGFQLRLCFKLGLDPFQWIPLKPLHAAEEARFYVLEHILFRPFAGDANQRSPLLMLPTDIAEHRPPLEDPYSLQVSVIFPLNQGPFQDEHFRRFAVKTVREETPAHLSVRILWFEEEDERTEFDQAYFIWIDKLRQRYTHDPPATD